MLVRHQPRVHVPVAASGSIRCGCLGVTIRQTTGALGNSTTTSGYKFFNFQHPVFVTGRPNTTGGLGSFSSEDFLLEGWRCGPPAIGMIKAPHYGNTTLPFLLSNSGEGLLLKGPVIRSSRRPR